MLDINISVEFAHKQILNQTIYYSLSSKTKSFYNFFMVLCKNLEISMTINSLQNVIM